MTTWIILAIVAQIFYAGVSLLDKYIVTSGKIAQPSRFAFLIGLLSSLTLIVFLFGFIDLPFNDFKIPSYNNVEIPSLKIILLSVISAVAFLSALICLFSALKKADASDVIPVVGSMSTVCSLLLANIFFNTVLTKNFVIGAIILAIGSLLVSLFHFSKKVFAFSLSAGFLFAIHYGFVKLVFNETNFDNGFFWTRVAIALVSLVLFILIKKPKVEPIFKKTKRNIKELGWVLLDKAVGGMAGILSLKAIQLGSVSVVQALGSLQFAFLLLFALFWGPKTPYACGENCTPIQRKQKFISVIVIIIGFIVLFI